jgi:hypothetical protein
MAHNQHDQQDKKVPPIENIEDSSNNKSVVENVLRIPHSPPLDLEPTPIGFQGIKIFERLPRTGCYCNEDTQRYLEAWINFLQTPEPSSDADNSQVPSLPHYQNVANNTNAVLNGLPSDEAASFDHGHGLGFLLHSPAVASAGGDAYEFQQSLDPPMNPRFPVEAEENFAQIHRHQDEKWNERYEQLRDFYITHGHSIVPYHYKDLPVLGTLRH